MKYRPEIDGLRALAVLPVLAFHAGISGFSGGFAGVDVFFVISGYLITKIISEEMKSGKFNFLDFYKRRSLRILPPLYIVILATLLLGYIFLLPVERHELAKSALSSVLFSSNIFFWTTSGYFDGAAELAPLLHTWSLGVEEQFYIIFPIVLLVAYRFFRSKLLLLVGLMVVGSFALSVVGVIYKPKATFYLLPFRAWELGIGALIALSSIESSRYLGAKHVRTGLGLLGLSLIAFAYIYLDAGKAFPGYNAIYPCLGAALIILAGRDSVSGRLLSVRPLVYVGLISYCLYLWHWPVVVYLNMVTDYSVLSKALIVISLSFALAIASRHLIEIPFRSKLKVMHPTRAAFASTASILLVGALCAATPYMGSKGLFSEEELRLSEYYNYKDMADHKVQFSVGVCFFASDTEHPSMEKISRCLTSSQDKKNYVLLGDSHAAHLRQGLQEALGENVNLMEIAASGCLPVLNTSGSRYCVEVIDYVLREYLPSSEIDGVIISARWRSDIPLDSVLETVDYVKSLDRDVIVLGPSVEYSTAFPSVLARESREKKSAALYNDVKRKSLDELMRKSIPDQLYISTYDISCPTTECTRFSSANEPMLFDSNHFTLSGARDVSKDIAAQIRTRFEPEGEQGLNAAN
ncbi:acyltransferase [Pseudomonas matsuisoli]|uniref:Acyltransferase n=2 Tax=Pseudomonas matsuisoli TaxID=1515666 RepID=A0A917PUT2_9PSED|nr:acyltransferase [Pseudomonas matsuisoli]